MKLRAFVLFVTISCAAGVLVAQSSPAHKPAAKNAAASKSSTPLKKPGGTVAAKTSSTKPVSHGKAPVRRVAAPPRQASPTSDRYKEIQNALVSKGYLKSEPNGLWDSASIDAMKRYQADQKQDPTGKLTAASIIGLGLGPHTASMGPAATAENAPPRQP